MNTLQHEHVIKWLELTCGHIQENKEYLTKLDSDIGDADHGFNMERGFNKVVDKLDEYRLNSNLGAIFKNLKLSLPTIKNSCLKSVKIHAVPIF